jgi:hypothetical protein
MNFLKSFDLEESFCSTGEETEAQNGGKEKLVAEQAA